MICVELTQIKIEQKQLLKSIEHKLMSKTEHFTTAGPVDAGL